MAKAESDVWCKVVLYNFDIHICLYSRVPMLIETNNIYPSRYIRLLLCMTTLHFSNLLSHSVLPKLHAPVSANQPISGDNSCPLSLGTRELTLVWTLNTYIHTDWPNIAVWWLHTVSTHMSTYTTYMFVYTCLPVRIIMILNPVYTMIGWYTWKEHERLYYYVLLKLCYVSTHLDTWRFINGGTSSRN